MSQSNSSAPPPDVVIVRELLAAGEEFVSGERLADLLGMSRVSVWAHIDKLRQAGYEVEAVRRKGYRLVDQPKGLDENLLRAAIPNRGETPDVVFLPSVDSTNSEAERLLAADAPTPFVVVSREQTKGRGRLGRQWMSEDCGNLYASFAFRPRLAPSRMQNFTLWMGVNVCEAIANTCRIDVGVKWPNDILHANRKLGGMLTEARMDADQTRDVVFGLGLNINGDERHWPAEIALRTTSVAQASGRPADINRVGGAIVGRVMNAFNAFESGEFRERFHELWHRFDVLRGRTITILIGDERIKGSAEGIDPGGALKLRDTHGHIHRCLAGDVTIEKAPLR